MVRSICGKIFVSSRYARQDIYYPFYMNVNLPYRHIPGHAAPQQFYKYTTVMDIVQLLCNCYYPTESNTINFNLAVFQSNPEKAKVNMEIPVQIHEKAPDACKKQDYFEVITINKGEVIRIEVYDTSVQVKCLDGGLWITEEGKPRDIVLQKGQSVELIHSGIVVISSFGTAKVCIISE
jgi:hypothetical protein